MLEAPFITAGLLSFSGRLDFCCSCKVSVKCLQPDIVEHARDECTVVPLHTCSSMLLQARFSAGGETLQPSNKCSTAWSRELATCTAAFPMALMAPNPCVQTQYFLLGWFVHAPSHCILHVHGNVAVDKWCYKKGIFSASLSALTLSSKAGLIGTRESKFRGELPSILPSANLLNASCTRSHGVSCPLSTAATKGAAIQTSPDSHHCRLINVSWLGSAPQGACQVYPFEINLEDQQELG